MRWYGCVDESLCWYGCVDESVCVGMVCVDESVCVLV